MVCLWKMVSVTENEIEKPRWWAQAILISAVIGAVLLLTGGLGTRLGIWSYNGGFTVASGGISYAPFSVSTSEW